MKTKEAIELIKQINQPYDLGVYEVIGILKRGEKYEKMWKELYKTDWYNADLKYTMDELKQKYFPEEGQK